jgi:uncharacterized Fe-S cluster-containing radical SAM superfamily enzyme
MKVYLVQVFCAEELLDQEVVANENNAYVLGNDMVSELCFHGWTKNNLSVEVVEKEVL